MTTDLCSISDQISMDLRKRRLIVWLRIPNETWTDVFRVFSRKELVQKLQPVCYRFKEIGDKNVPNLHWIEDADMFMEKLSLKKGESEVEEQFKDLTGSNCPLERHFRMYRIDIYMSTAERPRQHCQQKTILCQSLEMLRGCQLCLNFSYPKREDIGLFPEYLTIMEPTKPSEIEISLCSRSPLSKDILRHPVVSNCNRLRIDGHINADTASQMAIFDWLHQRPSDAANNDIEQQIRCLIFHNFNKIDWLVDGCVQDFQQSRSQSDRRQFVISFEYQLSTDVVDFEPIENPSTGEVLQLTRVMGEKAEKGLPIKICRLQRCLAKEIVNGSEEFQKKVLKMERSPYFCVVNENGQSYESPKGVYFDKFLISASNVVEIGQLDEELQATLEEPFY